MINNSKGKNVGAKQEGESNEIKLSKSSSSRQWAGFKNPRIVRVSRTFGGKDRHSKVCTIRGLRDRRIRLSVPSAVQLYDLQERLGVNQPSKVVDWLLDVTKDDIDKLPPLQMPPGDFYQQTHSSSFSPWFNSNLKYSKGGITINDDDSRTIRKSKFWDLDSRAKNKEVERENSVYNKWNSIAINHEQENEGGNSTSTGSYNIPQLSAQNFLQFPFPSLINNNLSYNWEPPNLSLSQFGSLPSQLHSHSSTTHSSSLPHPTPASQLVFYPPPPSYLPQYPYASSSSVENDPRNVNHFQFLSSSPSNMVPVNSVRFINPFNVNSKENSQNNGTDTAK